MSNLLDLDHKAFYGRNIPHEKHLFFNIGLEALNKGSYQLLLRKGIVRSYCMY
jgi:hypothetical protein